MVDAQKTQEKQKLIERLESLQQNVIDRCELADHLEVKDSPWWRAIKMLKAVLDEQVKQGNCDGIAEGVVLIRAIIGTYDKKAWVYFDPQTKRQEWNLASAVEKAEQKCNEINSGKLKSYLITGLKIAAIIGLAALCFTPLGLGLSSLLILSSFVGAIFLSVNVYRDIQSIRSRNHVTATLEALTVQGKQLTNDPHALDGQDAAGQEMSRLETCCP